MGWQQQLGLGNEKGPRLPRIPGEPHRREPLSRLLDKAGVSANDAESAEGEGLDVCTGPEKRGRRLRFDSLAMPEGHQRVQPRRDRCELRTADERPLRHLGPGEEPFERLKVAADERETYPGIEGPSAFLLGERVCKALEAARLVLVAACSRARPFCATPGSRRAIDACP